MELARRARQLICASSVSMDQQACMRSLARSEMRATSYTFRTIHEQNTPQTTSITPIRGYEKTRAVSGGRRSVVRVAWGRELQLYDREAGGGLSTSTYKHTAEKEEKTASTRPAIIVQETSGDRLGVSISEDRDK